MHTEGEFALAVRHPRGFLNRIPLVGPILPLKPFMSGVDGSDKKEEVKGGVDWTSPSTATSAGSPLLLPTTSSSSVGSNSAKIAPVTMTRTNGRGKKVCSSRHSDRRGALWPQEEAHLKRKGRVGRADFVLNIEIRRGEASRAREPNRVGIAPRSS